MDLSLAYSWILDELASTVPLDRKMRSLIARCEHARPHGSWARFRDLPFADTSALSAWLKNVFECEPPPPEIRAFWFGLFNPVYNGKAVADMYVSGSKRFNPDDMTFDWACGPDWWPENRYSNSTILQTIYRIAYEQGGLGNDAEYPLCLGYAALAVRHLISPAYPSAAKNGNAGLSAVAVGFDSGDGIFLGYCTSPAIRSIQRR